MPSVLARNWINVRPGEPAFEVATNICDYFELGTREGQDYWLEGTIVGEGEFLFNGRLFVPNAHIHGTIIDNFPKGPTPNGWTKKPLMDDDGYSLVDQTGKTVFGYRVVDKICLVIVNIYSAASELVAESLPHQFLLHSGPARIGRGGIFIG